MEAKCHIMCAENMIVGRWYKLMCLPTNHSDTYEEGSNLPYHYWYNFHLSDSTVNGGMESNDIVNLYHDTVYIKSTGEFTITATDINGKSDTKTITAIVDPSPSRTEVEITPTSWANLQELVTETYTLYIVPKGVYSFDLTDMAFEIPEGTIIDFSDSTLNITSEYKGTSKNANDYYKGFLLKNDHSGIKNANLVGNMYGDTSYLEWCTTVVIKGGYNVKVENITFKDLVGFNFDVMGGPTASTKCFTLTKEYNGAWKTNLYTPTEGYIGDDGQIVADTGVWTHETLIPILESMDRSYGVGHTILWIYSKSKVYDIAFYDENNVFIELRRYQQFFKKYTYPENAKYIRYGVYQDTEPANINPNDDICFIRQLGHFTTDFIYNPTVDAYINNIRYIDAVSSSSINVTGACQDLHINAVYCPYNGWYGVNYACSLNLEDGFNSMIGVVLSHCYLSLVNINGAQGTSLVSTRTGHCGLKNSNYAPTFINTMNGRPKSGSIGIEGENNTFCCVTAIDSHVWDEGTNGCELGTDRWHHCYSFGTLDADYVLGIQSR